MKPWKSWKTSKSEKVKCELADAWTGDPTAWWPCSLCAYHLILLSTNMDELQVQISTVPQGTTKFNWKSSQLLASLPWHTGCIVLQCNLCDIFVKPEYKVLLQKLDSIEDWEIWADQTTFAMLQVTEDEQGVSRAEGNVSLTNPTLSTNSIVVCRKPGTAPHSHSQTPLHSYSSQNCWYPCMDPHT